MSNAQVKGKSRYISMPDTLVILFGIVFLVYILSFFIPSGKFDTEKVSYIADGVTKSRTVVVANSYQAQKDSAGNVVYNPPSIFASDGKSGFLNFVYDGITSGSRDGGAVGVMAFILIIGGAFGIIMRTGVIEAGMVKLIAKMKNRQILILPVMVLLFSIGGAVFGMGEEAIAFALILSPMMVAMGYDALTAVLVTYLATQVGFATSWMNPFSVAIAQGIANIPVLSGSLFRIIMWAVFTSALIIYSILYAKWVQKNPKKSLSYNTDKYFREQLAEIDVKQHFGFASWLILAVLTAGMVWVVYGVVEKAYYIPEIATQFFTMGLIIGIISVVAKINNMTVNEIAKSFKSGAADLLAPALIVGMAHGIILMMGGTNPTDYTMLNTVLHSSANLVSGLNEYVSAVAMFIFQSVFNIFVTSGSGQAALTMPLMAPLSDLVGVGRQIAVLAFQLGDGWTHCIMPTSAALMGTLGVARIEYSAWVKFIIKFYAFLMLLSIVFLIIAVMVNYQ
ncbi:MAG: putative basic amino acid antiporter YfcC [Burkholderiales bacterium]|nr:putative basic amino acid antiporter YfcC [Burkholderiales bacterium]